MTYKLGVLKNSLSLTLLTTAVAIDHVDVLDEQDVRIKNLFFVIKYSLPQETKDQIYLSATKYVVIYDPASFYGHSEFELAISKMFGGFGSAFFDAYFNILPHQPGYGMRLDLYKLFNYINHWNHFGGDYRASTISTLQKLVQHTAQ